MNSLTTAQGILYPKIHKERAIIAIGVLARYHRHDGGNKADLVPSMVTLGRVVDKQIRLETIVQDVKLQPNSTGKLQEDILKEIGERAKKFARLATEVHKSLKTAANVKTAVRVLSFLTAGALYYLGLIDPLVAGGIVAGTLLLTAIVKPRKHDISHIAYNLGKIVGDVVHEKIAALKQPNGATTVVEGATPVPTELIGKDVQIRPLGCKIIFEGILDKKFTFPLQEGVTYTISDSLGNFITAYTRKSPENAKPEIS